MATSNFQNQGTVYLEGNPVKCVSLLTGTSTAQTAPKIINGSEREQIILCDPLTGLPLVIGGTVSSVSNQTPDSGGNIALGVPEPLSAGHVLASSDNGDNLILTGTPALTVNTGLPAGFGCGIKGAFTTTGTATVTDLRATTGTAWCCLAQTAADGSAYDLVGTK